MPEKSKLFTLEYVSDDDTGMFNIGEIWGIPHNDINMYINIHGGDKLTEALLEILYIVREADKKSRIRIQKLKDLNCGIGDNNPCK